MEKFKKLDKELKFKGYKIDVVKQRLITPENKEVLWDIVEHPGASAVIPVMDDGKIIMVKQYRATCDDLVLEIPAGVLDFDDEEPIECAKRELREETGYESEDVEFLYKFYSSIGIFDEVIHVFIANNLKPSKQDLDEHEIIELYTYTLDELIDMIFNGEIIDNKTISAILMYKEYLAKNER